MDKKRFPNKKAVEEQKADLIEADLYGASANFVDLKGANLKGAILRDANLEGVDFRSQNLDDL